MKVFFITLVLFSTSLASAMSGKIPPSNNHSGAEQCAFYDAGKTEEHGPHSTAQECERAHPNCQMRCFIYEYSCTAEGRRIDFVTQPDGSVKRVEDTRTYTGRDRDEFRAREYARAECERDFRRNDSCRLQNCTESASRTR